MCTLLNPTVSCSVIIQALIFFIFFIYPNSIIDWTILVSLFVFSPMSKLPVFDLSSHFLVSLFLFMKLYALTISIYFALCLTTLFWITVGFHSHTRWGNGEKIGHQRVTKGNRKHGFHPSSITPSVPWCVCGMCRPMPQAVENKCCGLEICITTTSRFAKLCLDRDVLELCIRNTRDIRNDREDNSPRSFRKAAYRQFILARHGHLGKGNRRVCPSCCVLKIRGHFPSVTGVYMGFREH